MIKQPSFISARPLRDACKALTVDFLCSHSVRQAQIKSQLIEVLLEPCWSVQRNTGKTNLHMHANTRRHVLSHAGAPEFEHDHVNRRTHRPLFAHLLAGCCVHVCLDAGSCCLLARRLDCLIACLLVCSLAFVLTAGFACYFDCLYYCCFLAWHLVAC